MVVSKPSYGKLYKFQNSLGFCELPAKVKHQFSYLPINFLSLFRYKSDKTKNLIKHVKLKEKLLLHAHKNYKPAGYYAYA